jgi:uncharacterized protein YndB with AHSA1/START domain
MNEFSTIDPFGTLTEPKTLEFRRVLPGPIDRVWAFVTESDLRRRWLAAGEMPMQVGVPFELVWRNHELSDPPGPAPDGFPAEQRMESRITALDPPRLVAFTWSKGGEVTIELTPRGDRTLLTLTHRGVPDHGTLLNVGAGWHSHLDGLDARLAGRAPVPFWDAWRSLRDAYAQRFPA